MEFKDYYKIMGVAPEATPDEIKKAYRILARKYHPDVSKEPNAEARFKEVGEAYEVLKDPEKRKAYDQLRQGGWRGGQDFTPPPGWEFQGNFGQGAGGFSADDAAGFSDFFSSLFGGGGFRQAGGFGGRQRRPQRQRGEDLQYKINISLDDAYAGTQRSIQLRVPEMTPEGHVTESSKTLNVKIPAGVTEGQQIRLAGQGQPGINGGPNGDLYLQIHIDTHPFYHLDGRNVTLALPVTPWEAALGATLTVPTLGGKIALKIPAHSQTGNKLRLKGRGLPGNPGGDQIINLQVVIPEPQTPAAKELYEQMAKEMPFNPRKELGV